MPTNAPQGKTKWGVGSFFQQAVSGVESRLDVILANEEDAPPSNKVAKDGETPSQSNPNIAAAKQTVAVSRSSSNSRKNDRLQERLARAMVKSQSPATVSSPRSSVEIPSRSSTPLPGSEKRVSLDSTRISLDENASGLRIENDASHDTPRSSHDSDIRSQASKDLAAGENNTEQEASDTLLKQTSEPLISIDVVESEADDTAEPTETQNPELEELRTEHKAAEARWQEETHDYIEKIDALQSKLKYLAKEAAGSAREAASAAAPGSAEKQLSEKDERIALLLEEGQKLAKTELENRAIIKKLRQQITDSTKQENDTKRRTTKLERDLANAEAKTKRAEASEKRAQELLNSQSKASRELEIVTSERQTLSATVDELKGQLERAVARAEAAESKAQAEALEKSNRRVADLEGDLSSAKIEKELSEEKLKREIRGLKDSLEREKESARVLEAELKGEQSVLESKMESLRSRAEEASSSAAGDAQAKLLRQIETLQTQYAVASENWQGIESSLLSRLTGVERERDEIARKEADLRRKAREVNIKAKKADEELETARETIEELERTLQETRQQVQKLRERVQKSEEEFDSLRKDATAKEKSIEANWSQKLEEERSRWRDQIASPPPFLQEPRTASPVASSRRSTGLSGGLDPLITESRPLSRRSSTLPAHADILTPTRTNSFPSFQGIGSPHVTNGPPNPNLLGAPPIHALEPDEYYSGSPLTPSAYGAQTNVSRGNGINEIISVSTVGAGPSVQLVERMSATVRRLESERAATKDELERITSQRDDARQEVVELIREIEEKRKGDGRIEELEAQVTQLDERYETTLELLGEKSEQVEELQADIADLKKIYRELVDSTMK